MLISNVDTTQEDT